MPLLNLSSSRDLATLERFLLALEAFLAEVEEALAVRVPASPEPALPEPVEYPIDGAPGPVAVVSKRWRRRPTAY